MFHIKGFSAQESVCELGQEKQWLKAVPLPQGLTPVYSASRESLRNGPRIT